MDMSYNSKNNIPKYFLIVDTNLNLFIHKCNLAVTEGAYAQGGISSVDTRNWGWMSPKIQYSQAFLKETT